MRWSGFRVCSIVLVAGCSSDSGGESPWRFSDPSNDIGFDASRPDSAREPRADATPGEENDSQPTNVLDGSSIAFDAGESEADQGSRPDRDEWPECVPSREPLHEVDIKEKCLEQHQPCAIANTTSNGYMCVNFRRIYGRSHGTCHEVCHDLSGCAGGRTCAFHDGIWGLCFDGCQVGKCDCTPGFGCFPFGDEGICLPINPDRALGAECYGNWRFGCDTGLVCDTDSDSPMCAPACTASQPCPAGDCELLADDWGVCR